ncbi:putative polyketide synthase [Mycobacterium ulcerans str. Harvey]|uniref:Polyketide synthase n=1 Tax=Mycobacterium ulcerans str. Harvey TaxID=1299332 RepID=A0ABN0QWH7_MYCUL|nr:putative polyketide synthase [Mycobacterium ulcerans str. Harvey]
MLLLSRLLSGLLRWVRVCWRGWCRRGRRRGWVLRRGGCWSLCGLVGSLMRGMLGIRW